ncbi:MAG: glycosyltransferase [Candidatus Gracilibacteria bacterium]
MKKRKTIILHDTFLYKGGGERLILMIAKAIDADLASGFFSKGSFDLRKEGFKGKMISISSEVFKKGFRHLKLKWSFLFNTKFLRNYDIVLFSGDSISAIRNCSKNAKKIYYCHTPPRYLYDLREVYLEKVPYLLKPIFNGLSYIFKKMYESDISKIDFILTNSENTKNRIKHFLGLESIVLYPPVDLSEFKFLSQKDYYLSFARLSDAKRVDKIVEAFTKMNNKKLVVIYGENDPAREKIFKIGEGYDNIKFVTLPGNIGFTNYVGNCIATVYIPIDEDFGMSPIESMSAGKPVLGVDEGGLKETIVNKKTGFLISEGAQVDNIIKGIDYLTPQKCLDMRVDCEKRAGNFSLDKFEEKLKKIIK